MVEEELPTGASAEKDKDTDASGCEVMQRGLDDTNTNTHTMMEEKVVDVDASEHKDMEVSEKKSPDQKWKECSECLDCCCGVWCCCCWDFVQIHN
mmetsp:Transcript_5631/g.6400  ORF Transcript_5631/g.6400 Transcript_5631/m.6400 type:complete len:95 (+) Transcript_5631:171-455(+)